MSASDDCIYCPISPRFEPDPDEDGRIPRICENLGYRNREKHGFYQDVETYTPSFQSKDGMTGSDLFDWDDAVHRRGLKEMAHEFLCADGRGPKYWPGRHGDFQPGDNDLIYLRDYQEIYRRLIYLFIKVNKRLRSKAIRMKAAADITEDRNRRFQEHSGPSQAAVANLLLQMGNSADDAIDIDNLEGSVPNNPSATDDTKSEASHAETSQHSTNDVPNDVPHSTGEHIIPRTNNFRATESPDHLAHDEHLDDMAQPARKRRKTWGRDSGFQTRVSPSLMSSAAETSSDGSTAADLRQYPNDQLSPTTTDMDVEDQVSPDASVADSNDSSVEPDSGLDRPATPKSTSASPADTQGNNENTSPAKFDPRLFVPRTEAPQRDPDMIPARVDSEPKSSPERRAPPDRRLRDVHKIDLVFSVNVSRGNNIRWRPGCDLFKSSLQDFFRELPLRGAFQALEVTLEVPRWRKKPKRFRDVIRRDYEEDFRITMTRFSQKVDAFKLGRTCRRLARRVVLEISVEPLRDGKIGNGAVKD